jgi:hypothetical protein
VVLIGVVVQIELWRYIKMKVTGYQLREARTRWLDRAKIASQQFEDSLLAFVGEKKLSPEEIGNSFALAELNQSTVEQAQQLYNSRIFVQVGNDRMSLGLAVKLLGGAGRLAKMWKTAATFTGKDRYSRYDTMRSSDSEYAMRQIPVEKSVKFAEEASKRQSLLRAAIAQGNSTEVEIDISPELLS